MIISEQVSAAWRRVSPATLATLMAIGLVKEELTARLNTVADDLCVASSPLRWRLVTLGKLKPATARSLPETALHSNGHHVVAGTMPALFPGTFVKVLGPAVERGNISMRRAADLLNLGVDDRDELLATHGIESSVEP